MCKIENRLIFEKGNKHLVLNTARAESKGYREKITEAKFREHQVRT